MSSVSASRVHASEHRCCDAPVWRGRVELDVQTSAMAGRSAAASIPAGNPTTATIGGTDVQTLGHPSLHAKHAVTAREHRGMTRAINSSGSSSPSVGRSVHTARTARRGTAMRLGRRKQPRSVGVTSRASWNPRSPRFDRMPFRTSSRTGLHQPTRVVRGEVESEFGERPVTVRTSSVTTSSYPSVSMR